MLDPGASPVNNVADGPWWVVLVTGALTLIGGWLPFHYGRRGVKAVTPAEMAGSAQPKPEPAPTGTRVVVDLPPTPVTAAPPKPVAVIEGSPEWAIVNWVNDLERRVDAAEKRAEEVQRRYDAMDKRWRERSDAQQRELYEAKADLRELGVKLDLLEAENTLLRGQLMGRPPP